MALARTILVMIALAFWSATVSAAQVSGAPSSLQKAVAQFEGASAPIVLAQSKKRSNTFLNFLRRDGKAPRVRRIRPGIIELPRRQTRKKSTKRRATTRSRSSTAKKRTASAPRAVVAIEKSPDAKRVLVVGDFMGRAIAKGLGEAYAKNKDVVIIDSANGSSGLVRRDYYDWPKNLPRLVEEQRADAIVVAIGSNDRQDLPSARRGTEAWTKTYGDRVTEFASALKATGKPVLWGGLVPVQASSQSKGYSTLNSIYQTRLAGASVPFIELWNGFADENGKYVVSGPDINGQTVKLRTSDGLNFTTAGRRKLAFFFESELNTILGTGTSTLLASIDASANADAGPTAAVGPMVPVDAMLAGPRQGLSTLSSLDEAGPQVETIVVQKLSTDEATTPPTGRVDNFDWPPQN